MTVVRSQQTATNSAATTAGCFVHALRSVRTIVACRKPAMRNSSRNAPATRGALDAAQHAGAEIDSGRSAGQPDPFCGYAAIETGDATWIGHCLPFIKRRLKGNAGYTGEGFNRVRRYAAQQFQWTTQIASESRSDRKVAARASETSGPALHPEIGNWPIPR